MFLIFHVPSQLQYQKKSHRSQMIHIRWCTRHLTPKLPSSTRKTLSLTQQGSTTSSSPSVVNLGLVTSSCINGHWATLYCTVNYCFYGLRLYLFKKPYLPKSECTYVMIGIGICYSYYASPSIPFSIMIIYHRHR